jgi:hypothetical protein
MWVTGAICAYNPPVANAQHEAGHKPTAQEVAEALADPSATITYFNVSYRAYMDVGPLDDGNHEFRLNGAGFFNLPNKTSVLYRAYLPLYITDHPDNSGVADLLLSAYWVPTKTPLILGYGAALIAPTASEDYYGTGKWSAGPALVVAKKAPGKYTVGGLLTHVWSFAGDSERDAVSMTTVQPALTCFLGGRGTSATIASETTYNWKADDDGWKIPLTLAVGQVLPPFGNFFVGVGVGASYYIEKDDFAPEWDLRGVVSVVFP